MTQRKFKLVTEDNWLEPDPLSNLIVKLDHREGTVAAVDGRDWINFINAITLGESVPEAVRDAYEFTVGAIGYAYFYYPLFTIVLQQLLRVADFAVAYFFEIQPDLPRLRTFDERLKALRQLGFFNDRAADRWKGIRMLRNTATHPEWQQNWGYSFLDIVNTIAELISNLPWPPAKGGMAN